MQMIDSIAYLLHYFCHFLKKIKNLLPEILKHKKKLNNLPCSVNFFFFFNLSNSSPPSILDKKNNLKPRKNIF